MDVRCPRCLTVQELGTALAPGEQRRVACPKCGAGIVVKGKRRSSSERQDSRELRALKPGERPPKRGSEPHRDAPEPPAEPAPARPTRVASAPPLGEAPVRRWTVRKPDGTELSFATLDILKQWSADGRVTPRDEISRNGTTFRPLADILELAGLFQSVPPPMLAPPPLPWDEATTAAADSDTATDRELAVSAERRATEGYALFDGLSSSPAASGSDGQLDLVPSIREEPHAEGRRDVRKTPGLLDLVPLPGEAPAEVAPTTPPQRSFELPFDALAALGGSGVKTSDVDEMDLFGSTLEMRRPATVATFDLGDALGVTAPPAPLVPVHDPTATTLQDFALDPSAPRAPVASPAVASPRIDPARNIQPVRAQATLPPPDAAGVPERRAAHERGAVLWVLGGVAGVALLVGGYVVGRLGTPETQPADASPKAASAPVRPPPEVPVPTCVRRPFDAGTARARAGIEQPVFGQRPRPPEVVADATPPLPAVDAKKDATARRPKEPEDELPDEPREKPPVKVGPKELAKDQPKEPVAKDDPKGEGKEPAKVVPPAEADAEPTTYDGFMAAAAKATKAGQGAKAIAYLEQAAKLNPRSVEPIAKIAFAYLAMGKATEAILKFEEAKSKNPGYRDAWLGLAKALEKAGRAPDAVTVYKQFLRMCGECPKAKDVRAALTRLGAEP